MTNSNASTFMGTVLEKTFKYRIGDINCICDTGNPDYVLIGTDNFLVYLLMVEQDKQMSVASYLQLEEFTKHVTNE